MTSNLAANIQVADIVYCGFSQTPTFVLLKTLKRAQSLSCHILNDILTSEARASSF